MSFKPTFSLSSFTFNKRLFSSSSLFAIRVVSSACLLLLLLLSRFSHVRLCATPWTAAYQASPSMGFSRQEYWSGVPLPSPMTSLGSVLKSKDIILPTKFHIIKPVVFPVVMYGCESWTIKKAEHRRIDAFKLWCWRRLLRVPWAARVSN